jgi:tripeptide aminopeptidase
MINKKRVLQTLLDLLKIDGPALCERPIADYLIKYYKEIGIKLEEDDSGNKIEGNAGNLYCYIPGDEKCEPIAFLAHMDTVKSTKGMEPIVTDEHIKTDGTAILGADDCLGVALMCELAHFLQETKTNHCPVEMIFTIAEEIGLLGIKNIDYKKIKSKTAYILDAGGEAGKIVSRAPSLERIKIIVKGKSAHSGACPEKGINAIAIAAKAISNIKQGRIDSETTLNIGKINGGEATNIVPESVSVEGEARSFKPDVLNEQVKNIEKQFQCAAYEFGGEIDFSHRLSFSTFDISKESLSVELAVEASKKIGLEYKITQTGGGSDANVLNLHGINSVALGIGYFNEHTNSEYISLEDFYKSLDWLVEIIKR